MQYQKAEIRQNIIDSAKNEFLISGFNAAKIADIAANADVPIGNLYRYFAGKAELFEAVVGQAYLTIPIIIAEWTAANSAIDKPLDEIMQGLTDELTGLFNSYGDELLILVDKSQGSSYADFSEKLNGLIFTYVKESVFKADGDDFFCMLLSNTLLYTAMDILRKGDKDSFKQLIKKALSFGLSSLEI